MSKHTLIGMELLRSLSKQGERIFSLQQARLLATELNINPAYLNELLFHLRQNQWIYSLKRGLYALDSSLTGSPIHEWEIGTALVTPSMVSHFSAFHHYELTDQIPLVTYLSTPKVLGTFGSVRKVNEITYHYIQTKPDSYFGGVTLWVGEARVLISDLEKTLLDGLRHPDFCGGFSEVFQAFEEGKSRLDLSKIVQYALRLEDSTIKRLGWILDHIGIEGALLARLEDSPIKGFRKLDAAGKNFGAYNKKWMIRENL